MAGVTLSAALVFIINQFWLSGDDKAKPVPVKKTAIAKPSPQPVKGKKISNAELQNRLQNWQPVVAYDSWGKDPFEGGMVFTHSDSSADSNATKLSGIVWRGNEALAIIGDKILRQGEETNSLHVVKIYKDKVIARRGNDLLTLHLGQDNNEQHTVTTSH